MYPYTLHRLEMQASQRFDRHALFHAENFDSNDFAVSIEVEDHAGLDLFGLNDGGFVESEVERVVFLVYA